MKHAADSLYFWQSRTCSISRYSSRYMLPERSCTHASCLEDRSEAKKPKVETRSVMNASYVAYTAISAGVSFHWLKLSNHLPAPWERLAPPRPKSARSKAAIGHDSRRLTEAELCSLASQGKPVDACTRLRPGGGRCRDRRFGYKAGFLGVEKASIFCGVDRSGISHSGIDHAD